jgi:hypothetical protein
MTDDARHELMEALAAVPERVRGAVAEAAGKPRPAGEWSLNAVVGHLTQVEGEVWQARFRQMAVEENPYWEGWEPEGIDWEGLYGETPLKALLVEFAAARQESVAYLRSLPDEGWLRQGTHEVWGPVDVARLCREMLAHDEAHIGQIGNMD